MVLLGLYPGQGCVAGDQPVAESSCHLGHEVVQRGGGGLGSFPHPLLPISATGHSRTHDGEVVHGMAAKGLGVRGAQSAECRRCPPLSARIDSFRDLEWWEEQQQRKDGQRHPGRFFPRLMTEERALNAAAQGNWRGVARDKQKWDAKLSRWLAQQDLDWASLDQLAIEG